MIRLSSNSNVLVFGPYTHPVLTGSSSATYVFNHNQGMYPDFTHMYWGEGAGGGTAHHRVSGPWQNTSGTYFNNWNDQNISKNQTQVAVYRVNSTSEPIYFKLFFSTGLIP